MRKKDLSDDPTLQFTRWFVQANEAKCLEANALSLATASKCGVPSVRTVLLKSFDANGFLFFTNYESRKAKELTENPKAALLFFWPELKRQVIIEGDVERCLPEVSEAYFASRPKGSQLGAWVSKQDQPIESRDVLEEEYLTKEQEFENQTVPLPPWWGGFLLVPSRFEFWQEGSHRLHDRFEYAKLEQGYRITRLSP